MVGRAGGVGGSPIASSATCRAVVAANVAALSALRAEAFASVLFALAQAVRKSFRALLMSFLKSSLIASITS